MTTPNRSISGITAIPSLNRRRLLGLTLGAAAAATAPGFVRSVGAQGEKPEKIRIDYAYYNPSSLVLRRHGWLEEDLARDDIGVEWMLSAGGNKANEFLRSDAVDFGSTAGSAALLAKANGSEIQTVYVYSQPEWTALVVGEDSDIESVEQLTGTKIAATKGTDPYFFLLQTLHEVGLTQFDVEVVNIHHSDGRAALERGHVDVWAGLDPHMARIEIEHGARLIYRNIDFNTYGVLNARIDFLEKYPALVERVINQYERARTWIIENPDDTAQILSEEARLSLDVAKKELNERTNFDIDVVPGDIHRAVIKLVIPILEEEAQLQPGADPHAALDALFAPQFAMAVVTR